MFVIVGVVVLIACGLFARYLWIKREGRPERDAEIEEALEQMREQLRERLRQPRTVVIGASVLAVLLIATMARVPSRWPLLLLALAAIAVGVAVFLYKHRRREDA